MPPKNVRSFRPKLLCLEDRTTPGAGALDPTFGVGGLARTAFPFPSEDYGRSTGIDSLRRIVVLSDSGNGVSVNDSVERFTPEGALDPSFGGTGVVTLNFGVTRVIVRGLAIDSQDRIIIAGTRTLSGTDDDFTVVRLTPAGAFDTSFDGDGKQFIDFFHNPDRAFSVAVDSLDRVIVAGYSGSFEVARLTVSGALDISFDGDGMQTIPFGIIGSSAFAVKVDSQNRIVIAGSIRNAGADEDFAVARLTVAGAIDNSFDGDGIETIAFGSGADRVTGVAFDAQGRIILGGYADTGSTSDFAVVRLTTTGVLDTSFDGDGKKTFDFAGGDDFGYGVAVDSAGRIVIAGYSEDDYTMEVARLTDTALLDATFDGDGKQTIPDGHAYAVVIDSLDRVVLGGNTGNGPLSTDVAVARLTVGGELDVSFDGDGERTLDLDARTLAYAHAIAVDHFGRTVVAGYTTGGASIDFAVARYTSSGALDLSFGGTGLVTIGFSQPGDYAYSVAIDSLNRVVVAGEVYNGSSRDIGVARLTASGVLDPSFDGDGKQTIAFTSSNTDDIAYAVAIDSLDRIVLAGSTYPSVFAVARLTTAGALDTTFNGSGKQTVDFGGNFDQANAVAIDSQNRVVVAGTGGSQIAVVRFTASGAFDNSFDGDGKLTIDFAYGANGVAIDSLGRIVLAVDGNSNSFWVLRITTSGAPDTSFNGSGQQSIPIGTDHTVAYAVAVDSQNRILVAGGTKQFADYNFAVARLTAGGAVDNSFDNDGAQTIAVGDYDDIAYGVAVTPAGQVVAAGITRYFGDVFGVVRLTGDTTTASAQVNDGSAQRSRVTSLTIRFSSQVTFSGSPDQAFTLVRTGGGSVSFTATVSVQNGGTVVLLDHFTGAETEFGSLADGRYTLTALASQISVGGQALDGDADGTAGGNFVFNDTQGLYRLFGDVNGDQTVNGFDLGFFRNAFGTQAGDSNYLSYLDNNGDGVINGFDLGQFRTRFGTMLP